MKVKRFIAADMRTAIQQVRESLGAEAVILSNRSVDDGVEILASNDYDETLLVKPEKPAIKSTQVNSPQLNSSRENSRNSDDPFQFTDSAHHELQEDDVSFSSMYQQDETQAAKAKRDREPSTEQDGNFPDTQADTLIKTRRQQPDYSRFIEDDEFAATAKNADSEELKKELQALRSLMEMQMKVMNWDKQQQLDPIRSNVLKRLTEMGVTADVARLVTSRLTADDDIESGSRKAIKQLIDILPVASDDILQRGGIVALVGPTGVGKTTTIAKLAARYVINHGRQNIALVSMDNYRIGAQEQLQQYARLIGIPVQNAKDSNELHKVLQNLYDKNLILIDTAGMSQRDMRICEQFSQLKEQGDRIRSYLVLAANSQTIAMDEALNAFKQQNLNGCIISKLDESASLGGAMSMLIRHQVPVSYVSNGQQVPEDLQPARAKELVVMALDMLKKHPDYIDNQQLAFAFSDGVVHAH